MNAALLAAVRREDRPSSHHHRRVLREKLAGRHRRGGRGRRHLSPPRTHVHDGQRRFELRRRAYRRGVPASGNGGAARRSPRSISSPTRAMMTAVGNDVGFAHIYVRQTGRAGASRRRADRGIDQRQLATTCSLHSRKRKEMGLVTIGLSGHDGGKMAQAGALDHCLVVPSDSIHRIQETHVAIYPHPVGPGPHAAGR